MGVRGGFICVSLTRCSRESHLVSAYSQVDPRESLFFLRGLVFILISSFNLRVIFLST